MTERSSRPLGDGEEGGGSVFSEFDNVTVEVEGFSTPPQLPAVPQGQQGHNSEALSPAISVGSDLSDLLHSSDNEDHMCSSVDKAAEKKPEGGSHEDSQPLTPAHSEVLALAALESRGDVVVPRS